MSQQPRWGEGYAGRMFHRGWDELRSIASSFFHGSDVVQPDYQYAAGPREPSAFAQAVEQSRQVPGAGVQNQQEQDHGREASRDHGHER